MLFLIEFYYFNATHYISLRNNNSAHVRIQVIIFVSYTRRTYISQECKITKYLKTKRIFYKIQSLINLKNKVIISTI